jgi:serine/threonine protein kinase
LVVAIAKLVAIKRISKRRVLNPGLRESVWIERDVMSRVKSPFTLQLHHSFQDNDELYLVMPFFRGGDLDYYMEVINDLTL